MPSRAPWSSKSEVLAEKLAFTVGAQDSLGETEASHVRLPWLCPGGGGPLTRAEHPETYDDGLRHSLLQSTLGSNSGCKLRGQPALGAELRASHELVNPPQQTGCKDEKTDSSASGGVAPRSCKEPAGDGPTAQTRRLPTRLLSTARDPLH